MKKWIRNTISVGALAVGVLAMTAGTAQAGPVQIAHGNSGLLSGNNIAIPLNFAGNFCGNGIGIVGGGLGISNKCVAVAVQH